MVAKSTPTAAEPETTEKYLNLYCGAKGFYLGGQGPHLTKAAADAAANDERIACVKIAFRVEIV